MKKQSVKKYISSVICSTIAVSALTVFANSGIAKAESMQNHTASVSSHKPVSKADLKKIIDKVVKTGIPGAIALVRDGNHITTVASGLANVDTKEPMTTNNHMRIGSITKMFTSVVTLQLVSEKKLNLDDTVEHWLPNLVPNGDHITVRELLQMNSGLFNFSRDQQLVDSIDGTRVWSPRELIAIANSHKPSFEPGTAFEYSNTNYVLLGLIIEEVTHKSYQYEVEHRIIKPLGLHDTTVPGSSTVMPSPHAEGYYLNIPDAPYYGKPAEGTSVNNPSQAWSAGELISTAKDVAKFQEALFTGHLLKPQQLTEMKKTFPTGIAKAPGYGLGLLALKENFGTVWGHDGNFNGFYSNAFTSNDGRKQVVLLTNGDQETLNSTQRESVITALDEAFGTTTTR